MPCAPTLRGEDGLSISHAAWATRRRASVLAVVDEANNVGRQARFLSHGASQYTTLGIQHDAGDIHSVVAAGLPLLLLGHLAVIVQTTRTHSVTTWAAQTRGGSPDRACGDQATDFSARFRRAYGWEGKLCRYPAHAMTTRARGTAMYCWTCLFRRLQPCAQGVATRPIWPQVSEHRWIFHGDRVSRRGERIKLRYSILIRWRM